jgi:hypothetical protein
MIVQALRRRVVFSIGIRAEEDCLENSCSDLLTSKELSRRGGRLKREILSLTTRY